MDRRESASSGVAPLPAPESEVDRVYAGLRDEIVTGRLPAGELLVERLLSERFGLSSRVPIREALRRLKAQGLIDHEPRRRARVHELTPRERANLAEMYLAFDSLSLNLAAQRRDDQDLAQLRRLAEVCRSEKVSGDPEELIRQGLKFREAVFSSAKNTVLDEVRHLIQSRLELLFNNSLSLKLGIDPTMFGRAAEAIAERDSEAAVEVFVESTRKWQRAWHEGMLSTLDSEFTDDSDDKQHRVEHGEADSVQHTAPHFVRVADTLRRQIIIGVRQPGDVLSERNISLEFDVSRYPVRQAIEVLVREGLVTEGSDRAASRVRPLSDIDGIALIDVCTQLDSTAARLAAERASSDHLRQMRRIVAQEEEFTQAEDNEGLLEAAFEWREVLHRMAENELVHEINGILKSRMRLLVTALPFSKELVRAHQLTFEAIALRNPLMAEAVLPKLLNTERKHTMVSQVTSA